MSDRVSIPALGKHRHRDDAPDSSTKLARFTDRIHDLAEQFLIGDILARPSITASFDDLAAEAVDFIRSHITEVIVERIIRFELLAIDEQRVRSRQWVQSDFVEIAEEREPSVLHPTGTVLVRAMETRDEVVNQF